MRIGVDLGGTNVRAGLVKDGHIVRLLSEPCKADRPEGEVVDHIASLIGELMRPEVSRIGIGVPSVVDAARGIVYNVVGIPSWREVYLKDLLEKRFSVPVHVNNDCNCFALGVCRFGEASAFSDVVCVALGTGVGAGVVIGGKLYCGRDTGRGGDRKHPVSGSGLRILLQQPLLRGPRHDGQGGLRARRWRAIPKRWRFGASSGGMSASW